MAVTLALAALIVVLSLAAGSVVLRLGGSRRGFGLEAAVGFAALVVVAGLAVRLPGRAATAAALIAALLAAGLLAARRSGGPPPTGGQLVPAAAVAAVLVLAGVVPFALEGRAGVLGEGIYTNDHAAQLYWTDWLQHGFGPEPTAVAWGYPVGPPSLVAAVAEASGASLVDAFNGLLVAIPALTGLTALALVRHLRPAPRTAAAALAGMPFLAASFLAQSAFKETAMALLVLGFAATLALATEAQPGARPPLRRRAAAAAAGLLVLGGILTYSVPALAWFVLTAAGWLALAYVAGAVTVDWRALRDALWRRRLALAVVGLGLAALVAVSAGRFGGFVERIGDVSQSAGRLSSPVFPGEALAVWPEGDFRVVRGEVDGALLATALGAAAVVGGALVLVRRRAYATLAALGSGALVYLGARAFSSIHVEAKALAVMAPLAVVVALGGLLAAPGRWRRPAAALAVVFALAALASTFLALRAAPVGFSDRGAELEELAARAEGKRVAFLGVDRFAAYWLRGTLIRSPGGYVPPEVRARAHKVWRQGRAMDLDTLAPSRLDEFDYAITTTAAYQSSPPANAHEVARTSSYVLWDVSERTPRSQVLDEGGEPGAPLTPDSPAVVSACRGSLRTHGGGLATTLPEPVVGGPRRWSRPVPFEAPGRSTQKLRLGPGRWHLSLQYHSQVDLTVRAADLEAELPASLVGMYLTHQGQSSFWPVGEVELPRGARVVSVEIEAREPASLAGAVGATRRVWLGELAATRLDPLAAEAEIVPLGAACGRYVDRYVPR